MADGVADNFDKTMVVQARPAVTAAQPLNSGFSTVAGDSQGLGAFHAGDQSAFWCCLRP